MHTDQFNMRAHVMHEVCYVFNRNYLRYHTINFSATGKMNNQMDWFDQIWCVLLRLCSTNGNSFFPRIERTKLGSCFNVFVENLSSINANKARHQKFKIFIRPTCASSNIFDWLASQALIFQCKNQQHIDILTSWATVWRIGRN